MLLVGRAHIGDIAKCPGLNASPAENTNDRSEHLGSEHDPWGNLHIMAHLHVAGEAQCLISRGIGDRLEHHIRDRVTGYHETTNHLGKDANAERLVGDSLKNADGKDENDANDNANNVCPDGKPGISDLVAHNTEYESDNGKSPIPPTRNIGISGHQARVNIGLLTQSAAELASNILTIPD